jgi:hypothetical protein
MDEAVLYRHTPHERLFSWPGSAQYLTSHQRTPPLAYDVGGAWGVDVGRALGQPVKRDGGSSKAAHVDAADVNSADCSRFVYDAATLSRFDDEAELEELRERFVTPHHP